jgi:polar amino acid transport system substrate-binding protein
MAEKMKKILILLVLLLNCCTNKETFSYRIALDPLWTTTGLKGREQNLNGFTSDVFKEISKQQNIQIQLVMRNLNNLVDGLTQKKYEGMLSTIHPYLFNLQTYDFSELFLTTGPVLVVATHSPYTSLKTFEGKEIGLISGSNNEVFLEDPLILPRFFDSVPQALNAVANGEIEGALIEGLIAQTYCNDLYQHKLKITSEPLNTNGIRLLTVHGENGLLIEQFNKGLEALHASGQFQKLQQKWFLTAHCPQ